MALPEKLYALRKKSGLSQEQLAEALNVSRQAISKWEGGSATPESDKLLALSNYFGVSLDYLLKDGAPNAAPAEAQEEHRTMRLLSLILCFGGAAALIVYGVLSILVRSRADQRIVDDPHRRQRHFSAALRRGHCRGRGAAAQKYETQINREVSP